MTSDIRLSRSAAHPCLDPDYDREPYLNQPTEHTLLSHIGSFQTHLSIYLYSPSVGMSTIEDVPPVPKVEHFEEESFSESSPDPEEQSLTQEPAQVQKRKGGRKPVCPSHCF